LLIISFSIGGFDGSAPLNTAECYNPKTMKWSQIASMSQCRFGVGCCVLEGEIYAIGGSDGCNLRSCEKYNPEKNIWLPVSSMSVARFVIVYFYASPGIQHGTPIE